MPLRTPLHSARHKEIGVAALLLRIHIVVLPLCSLPKRPDSHGLVAKVELSYYLLGSLVDHLLADALPLPLISSLLLVDVRMPLLLSLLVFLREAHLPLHPILALLRGFLTGVLLITLVLQRILVFVELSVIAIELVLSGRVLQVLLSDSLTPPADAYLLFLFRLRSLFCTALIGLLVNTKPELVMSVVCEVLT